MVPNNFANGSNGRCKLAIVGMAGRFPDAASHEKLWELLEKGLDVHREVPKDRFDAKYVELRNYRVLNHQRSFLKILPLPNAPTS